jgi:hypothetical protein
MYVCVYVCICMYVCVLFPYLSLSLCLSPPVCVYVCVIPTFLVSLSLSLSLSLHLTFDTIPPSSTRSLPHRLSESGRQESRQCAQECPALQLHSALFAARRWRSARSREQRTPPRSPVHGSCSRTPQPTMPCAHLRVSVPLCAGDLL